MLFIRSRLLLTDEDRVGPTDEFWDIRIRRGAKVRQDPLSGFDDILSAVRRKRVLLLVHGYNNLLDDVIRAYGLIEEMVRRRLRNVYDVILGYTWPGGDSRFDYFSAKTRAGALAPRFSENLRALTANAASRPAALDIMTHSMGSRLTLEAIKHFNRRNVIRNLLLMASAVDNESIERGEEYFAPARSVRNAIVFHSRHDHVLKYAYALAEFDAALGLNGPEDAGSIMRHSPATFVVNCKNHVRSHGGYKSSDAVYRFLAQNATTVRAPQFSTL